MSKRQILIILGLLVMVTPVLGIPENWKNIYSLIVGFIILLISINLPPSAKKQSDPKSLPYTDHQNSGNTENTTNNSTLTP